MTSHQYIPALSLKWLTPLYDALVEGPMSALRMRKDLLALARDLNGLRILDVGCGTGTLALMMKKANPAAEITGLDGDPRILVIAQRKSQEQRSGVRFDLGMSFALPYPDASFDVVTTSLMLHHLDRTDKEYTVAEMYRVLRPSGRLYGIDFAETRNLIAIVMRPFERVADNFDGLLPVIFRQSGFTDIWEERRYLFKTISLFHASKI